MKTFLEYFEEVSEMPKDELAAYVESELVEAMMDTDDYIYTEATNSEAHKAMAELRQNVSALKKDTTMKLCLIKTVKELITRV